MELTHPRMHRTGILLALWLLVGMTAQAKDEMELELKVKAVEAYQAMPLDGAKGGYRHELKLPEAVFLCCHVEILPKWDEANSNTTLKKRMFQLVTGKDKKEYPLLGYIEDSGEISVAGLWETVDRPDDWKKKQTAVAMKLLFAVPETPAKASLRLNDKSSASFSIPKARKGWPAPTGDLKVSVLKAELVDSISFEDERDSIQYQNTISNPAGKILRLELSMLPSRVTARNGSYWFCQPWFALEVDDGVWVKPLGRLSGERYLPVNVEGNIWPKKDGSWKAKKDVFLFPVPKKLRSFKVLFFQTPVASGKATRSK